MKNSMTKKIAAIAVSICMLMSVLAGLADGLRASVGKTTAATGGLVISEAGEYTLTGNMRGTVYVDPGAGDVTLTLDNVRVNSIDGPAINAVSGNSLTIRTAEGSSNTLVGSAGSAVVQSNVNVIMDGDGKVNVSGSQAYSILVNGGSLAFNGGSSALLSTGAAYHADGGVQINGGTVIAIGAEAMEPVGGAQTSLSVRFDQTVSAGSKVSLTEADGRQQAAFTANQDFAGILMSTPSIAQGSYQLLIDEAPALVYGSTTFPVQSGANRFEAENPMESAWYQTAQASEANPAMTPVQPETDLPDDSGTELPAAPDGTNAEPPALPEDSDAELPAAPDGTNAEPPALPEDSDTELPAAPDGTNAEPPALPEDSDAELPAAPDGTNGTMPENGTGTFQPGSTMPGQQTTVQSADEATEIVTGVTENSAADLVADLENATLITVTDEESQVSIDESGTYIVTGSSSDGNITVKKGTTGVVLVLEDLDLTSTTGATLSINKNAEVKVIVSGDVSLTDAENPDDETSEDADVADAFDGAAIKIKAESVVYMTGDGTLTINGAAKNGIKIGDDASLIIDGELTINITAANDGINANYDLTIKNAKLTIAAGDDAIHADHILTIGDQSTGSGPVINITSCNEGLEGTVVNVFGGNMTIVSSDDAINAANGDGIYEGELDYSFNMTGGTVVINSVGDGVDSNGNVNLIDGTMNITSSSVGGEAGIDYVGQLYISDNFVLNNNSGVASDAMMPGMPGQDQGAWTSGQTMTVPGQDQSSWTPDQSQTMPGQSQDQSSWTPGQTMTVPGQSQGQSSWTPDQSQTMPGQSQDQSSWTPGQTMTVPGQSQDQSSWTPGQTMTVPGQSQGQSSWTPGQTMTAPGQSQTTTGTTTE